MNIKNFFYRNIQTVITIMLLFVASRAIAQDITPKYETRAVWLTTLNKLDWPKTNATSQSSINTQKEELCNILDKLMKAGINTVMLQTRVRATALYNSEIEPWDNCLTGTTGRNPGYDPLEFAIEECHKRGMELHAWIVTIPVGKWQSEGCKRLRKKMPAIIRNIGGEGYMNPERKETGDYLAKICSEVTKNYDIDGIHLDYIRYPETWKLRVNKNQGRKYITDIVEKIYKAVKSQKQWVKITCSPIGKHDNLTRFSSKGWNARTRVCQDAQKWLKDGLMDGLYPMMYFRGNDFFPFAIDWTEKSYGKTIVAGLGIYFMRDRDWPLEDIIRQLKVGRNYGMGHAYFRSKFLTDNTKGIYDYVSEDFYKHPSLIPPMTWHNNKKPSAPSKIEINRLANADHIAWTDGMDNSDGDYLLYNVYASNEYPVNINDTRNLIKQRTRAKSMTINHNDLSKKNINYAVTAIDRYGNESDAIATEYTTEIIHDNSFKSGFIKMPQLPIYLDARFIVVENQLKDIVMIAPYNNTINAGNLRDGVYTLRTMGKKAVTHRVGWLKIITDRNNEKKYYMTTVWKK